MNSAHKYDLSYLALIACLLIFSCYPIFFGFPSQVISWDVLGYYLYLPQTFIENDIALTNTEPVTRAMELYDLSPSLYQAHPLENGNHVIQYTSGLSILYSPFFFIGHFIAQLFSYPADGYSAVYQYSILAGSYFYSIIGLVYMRKVLLTFFTPKFAALGIILTCIGTNYYSIHTLSHGLSHIYLFTFYTLLIWHTIKWHKNKSFLNSIILGLILGLMTLCRATEIMAALIPILFGVYSIESFKTKLKTLVKIDLKPTLIVGFSAIALGSIQLVYWKYTTGHFLYNSYTNPGEGLDLNNPYLINFLFSFRKGWFIYTPIAILGLYGLSRLQGSLRQKWLIPLSVFMILNIYISSCWSNWWYATSFSQRTMVQSYIIIAIGLSSLFHNPPKTKGLRHLIMMLALFFFALNLFQSWQYKHGLIHFDRMTKASYFAVFGETQHPENFNEMLLIDRENEIFSEDLLKHIRTISLNKENETTLSTEYSEHIDLPYSEITKNEYAWLKTSFEIKVDGNKLDQVYLVQTFMHNGGNYHYKTILLSEYMKNSQLDEINWCKIKSNYITPEVRYLSDPFRTFIWNPGKQKVTFRNFKVSIYEPKEQLLMKK